jgi:hypothetical protein
MDQLIIMNVKTVHLMERAILDTGHAGSDPSTMPEYQNTLCGMTDVFKKLMNTVRKCRYRFSED